MTWFTETRWSHTTSTLCHHTYIVLLLLKVLKSLAHLSPRYLDLNLITLYNLTTSIKVKALRVENTPNYYVIASAGVAKFSLIRQSTSITRPSPFRAKALLLVFLTGWWATSSRILKTSRYYTYRMFRKYTSLNSFILHFLRPWRGTSWEEQLWMLRAFLSEFLRTRLRMGRTIATYTVCKQSLPVFSESWHVPVTSFTVMKPAHLTRSFLYKITAEPLTLSTIIVERQRCKIVLQAGWKILRKTQTWPYMQPAIAIVVKAF